MGNKRWSEAEEYALISFIGANFKHYTTGVKTKFYTSASDSLKTKASTQVKSKCVELEGSYKEYKAKLSRSGFGVKESDPTSIKELLAKKCKYFYQMDEIFGSQHDIVPPVIMEPGRTEFNLQGVSEQPAAFVSETVSSNPDQAINRSVGVAIDGNAVVRIVTSEKGKNTPQGFIRSPPPIARMLESLQEDRERDTAKRHKADMDLRVQELALKKEHFALYKEELRLKESWISNLNCYLSKSPSSTSSSS